MKVYIDRDEWYPVFSASDSDAYGADPIEVDEATYRRWVAADEAFMECQREMREALTAAGL